MFGRWLCRGGVQRKGLGADIRVDGALKGKKKEEKNRRATPGEGPARKQESEKKKCTGGFSLSLSC